MKKKKVKYNVQVVPGPVYRQLDTTSSFGRDICFVSVSVSVVVIVDVVVDNGAGAGAQAREREREWDRGCIP